MDDISGSFQSNGLSGGENSKTVKLRHMKFKLIDWRKHSKILVQISQPRVARPELQIFLEFFFQKRL